MALPSQRQWTPLHAAAKSGDVDKVRELLKGGEYDVNCVDVGGWTPLQLAADRDHLDVVRVLISEFKADVNACTDSGETPLHKAADRGHLDMVKVLVSEFKADVNASNNSGKAPIDKAVINSREEVALAQMNEFHCDTKQGTPYYMHTACDRGWVNLVRALVQKHGTGILTCTYPLHNIVAEFEKYRHKVAVMLVKEFGSSVKDLEGQSLLHIACEVGNVILVQTSLKHNSKAYITATDNKGRSLLHSACASVKGSLVRLVSQYISPWVVDDNGDTPLHICARLGNMLSSRELLKLDPPVMIRNNLGQTPRDLEKQYHASTIYDPIDAYMKENKGKIYSQYEVVRRHSEKKYSLPEPITRAFVVGNPGAGKSSLVEALKREGLLDSFRRVSESSVPPHTAGIVPSIHISKHYGRILFYDFAGDAEYYSSHAAILENLASSRKGENIFLLVIDMTEEVAKIKKTIRYWLSFIQHQQFHGQKPRLIVVGSHLDLLTEDVAKARGKEFQAFYDSIDTEAVQMSALFMLDCCKPRSKQIAEIHSHMGKLTRDSTRYKLSLQASTLLGLLEKDFHNEPACSTQALLSHIEDTSIRLLAKEQSLHPILLELHDLGLLFLIDSNNRESSSVVLNMSQLTNIVHKSLFSEEAILKETFEKEGFSFSLSAGIIPQSILAKILPKNITKECLVQLQYCQDISHAEAHVFSPLKMSNSADQSFLFFPALCSADKSEVEWVTPPDLSYGIGWLARCTGPCDYLSPRFHHVLLLRLVFKFTLSAHPPADQVLSIALLTSVTSSVAAHCGRQGSTG